MEKVEEFIQEHIKETRSPVIDWDGNIAIYKPWITIRDARRVAEIAREETIKEVCEWLDNHTILSEKWYIEDLKKYLERKK